LLLKTSTTPGESPCDSNHFNRSVSCLRNILAMWNRSTMFNAPDARSKRDPLFAPSAIRQRSDATISRNLRLGLRQNAFFACNPVDKPHGNCHTRSHATCQCATKQLRCVGPQLRPDCAQRYADTTIRSLHAWSGGQADITSALVRILRAGRLSLLELNRRYLLCSGELD
jgi:hypothetical protein